MDMVLPVSPKIGLGNNRPMLYVWRRPASQENK